MVLSGKSVNMSSTDHLEATYPFDAILYCSEMHVRSALGAWKVITCCGEYGEPRRRDGRIAQLWKQSGTMMSRSLTR